MPRPAKIFELNHFSADVAHWAKVATWSRDEVVALSLGKDPRRVNWEKVGFRENETAFTTDYAARRMIVERSYGARQLGGRTAPLKVLEWAKRIGLSMPADLTGAVEAIGDICADEATNGDKAFPDANPDMGNASAEKTDRGLSPRERDSLLKLVIGMAIKGYGHDPSRFRNGTATEIASDLQLLGLSLSDDTIRKFLQEASALLPKSETKQKR